MNTTPISSFTPHAVPGGFAEAKAHVGGRLVFEQLTTCEHCDLLFRKQALRHDQLARCPRCEAIVERGHRLGLEGQLALTLAALILFFLANAYPIVTLDLRGARADATMLGALHATWNLQQRTVAVIAALTGFVFPLVVILLRLYVTAPLLLDRMPPAFGLAMRVLRIATRWTMVEVFVLGVLVSIVRVAGLASVAPGVGIFSFGTLTLLLTAIEAAGMHGLWERSAHLRHGAARP